MVMRLYDAGQGRAELRSCLALYSAAREQPHIISVCGERQLSLEQIILAETFLLSKSGLRGLFGLHMTHSQMLGKIEYTLPAKF